MSREEQLRAPNGQGEPDDHSPEDLRLQIDLRLRFDEVAEFEAERLRHGSRREPTRRELCRLACQMYDARRTRDKMLDRKLFGEPGWDMLLALYCLPARGELLGITGLTHAADVPESTGHRWQVILMEQGLIERGPKEVDRRMQFVRLTQKGRDLLEGYLTRLYYYDAPVPPYPEAAGG